MNQINTSTLPVRIWLVLALLLYVAFWFMYPQEYIASDPGAYSARAFAMTQNLDFGHGDVFDQRLGVTAPAAFFYSTLGVSVLTTNLWPLLAALLIIVTVWLALPDDKSKIIGALLCLTSIPLLQASIALYPDIIAAALMATSSLILFNREKYIQYGKARLLVPLTAVLLLFMAFLAKESAYWILPLWAWALSSDIKNKSMLVRQFHFPAILAGLFLGIAYLIFCNVIWGDPLARFRTIEGLTGQHLWSWDKAAPGELLKRLTVAPINLFLNQYGPLALLLAILGIVVAPRPVRPWTYYAACCLVFFWFGSTSFTRYEPMPLVERMTLPLLPALYVLAAFAISRFSINSERAGSINTFVPILLVLGFVGLPFIQYVQSSRGVELPEATAMAMLRNDVKRHPEKEYLLACSDSRSPDSLLFYFGYRYPKNLHVVFAGNLTDALLQSNERIVFVDVQRSAFLKSAYGLQNYDEEIEHLGLTPIYVAGNVALLRDTQQEALKKLIPPNPEAGKKTK